MNRLSVVSALILSTFTFAALSVVGRGQTSTPVKSASASFRVVEATIPEMRMAMEQKRLTSRELVSQYLIRLATYEDVLHAALAVNPRALEEADELDRERAQGRIRGPLHGIPVALKDNIHTTFLRTKRR